MTDEYKAAIDAITSERAYQDAKWGDNLDKTNTVTDYATYMDKYMEEVKNGKDDNAKLESMRKVAALAVKAMEVYGAPQRDGFPVCDHCGEVKCPGYNEECPKFEAEATSELSEEQLDKIVQNEQQATKVEKGKWYRVNEKDRSYSDNGKFLTIFNVRAFCVQPNGAHRLVDAQGRFYYVQPWWTCLSVEAPQLDIL